MVSMGMGRFYNYSFISLDQVQIDVRINEWFGDCHDMIQKALGEPNSITITEYWAVFFHS